MEMMRRFARWSICGGFVLWPVWIMTASLCGLYDLERATFELTSCGAIAVVLVWVYLDVRRHRQERELREMFDFGEDRDDYESGF